MSIYNRPLILLLICLLCLTGCPSKPSETPRQPSERPLLELVSTSGLPDIQDDQSAASLRSAIQKSLISLAKIPDERMFLLGDTNVPAKVIRESLNLFVSIMDSGRLSIDRLSDQFDIFRLVPPGNSGKMLVTGYYEPVLEGSLKPDGKFKWPIYPVPSDLLMIELDRFDKNKFRGERLVGRVEKNQVVPYYSRSEIDGGKVLEKSGIQSVTPLAWLKDPVDSFFLHIQGSGVLRLPNGSEMRVGYAGANGRPYNSIGKYLIASGAVSREEMSLQSIREYLSSHPEDRDKIMWKNESYVFFKRVTEGPLGSLGVVLTEGRSIASDPKFHPRGSLAFLVSEKPVYNRSGEIERWEAFGRWVLNQDTGGAIKGPERIDLFCGTGNSAEKIAGPMKQSGELFYFIKKGLVHLESK